VKAGGAADDVRLVLEAVAVLGHRVFERLDGRNMRSDERLVAVLPEMRGGLQLGRVGREEDPVDALGELELGAGLLARLIKRQDDALGEAGAHRLGKGLPSQAQEGGAEASSALPLGAPGEGGHEGEHLAPLEAVRHPHQGTRSLPCPDGAQQRSEAHAMLVGGPALHAGPRIGGLDRRYLRAESVCCKAAWACGSAVACRGRGR
jgi:hypothetical protein